MRTRPPQGHRTPPDGPGTAPHKQEAPGGATALPRTCQSPRTETQERKSVQTWGEMLNLPTAPYSQTPAREHVQLKEPRLASQVQPIGKLGASTDGRVSAEKQLTALGILEKSARQTLLKSRLYKELHRVAYTFQTEKSVPLTGDHQGGKPGQNTPRHTTVILLISEDPGEASEASREAGSLTQRRG